jgi:putative tricarboxylic transport membrane protein
MASSRVDLVIMIIFGVAGYLMKKFEYESTPTHSRPDPGPMMEDNLRQSMIISKGDFSIFFTRPISIVILDIMTATVFLPYLIRFSERKFSGHVS